MANNLTRGQTFTTQATAQMLNDLVDLGSVHSINRNGFDTVTRPVTATGSDISSPVAGEIQFRTDQIGAQISDGTNFHDIPTVRRLTNKSGGTRTKGDVVVSDSTTDNSFTTSTSSTYRGEVGVLLEAAAADEVKTVRFNGHVVTVNVDGAVTKGQYLKLSTGTAGKATGTTGFSTGVFARVVVGGSSSCSAILFGVTLSADLTDGTFEWEAGRTSVTIDGSRLGQVSFSSAFTEAPVVVATIETTDASAVSFHTILAGDDPLNNFRILSASTGTPKVFHWFACTPGTWIVNGNLIIAGHINAGTTAGNDRMIPIWFPRTFARNPAALLNLGVDGFGNNQPGGDAVEEVNFIPANGRENSTDADALDKAGRSGGGIFLSSTTTSGTVAFIFVIPTAALQISDGPTWGGAGTLKTGVGFEAGVFKRSTSGETGTLTFSAAFASNPATILGMSTTTGLSDRWFIINSASDPGTSSFPYRTLLGLSTDGFVSFFSVIRGKNSTSATRL